MRSAMSFYSSEFGSYPFGSHKIVFVDELPTQRFDAATISLVNVDVLPRLAFTTPTLPPFCVTGTDGRRAEIGVDAVDCCRCSVLADSRMS